MSGIVRVFQAEVKPGMEDEFRHFFLEIALPMVRGHDGLSSVQVGLPTEDSPHSFCMITTWTSVEALKGFTGERWSEAVIDPREAHLLESVRVEHYVEGPL